MIERTEELDQAMGTFARMIAAPDETVAGRELAAFADACPADEVSERLSNLALCGPVLLGTAIQYTCRESTGQFAAMQFSEGADIETPHHVFVCRLTTAYLNGDDANWDALIAAHEQVHGSGVLPEVLTASLNFVAQSVRGLPQYREIVGAMAKLGR